MNKRRFSRRQIAVAICSMILLANWAFLTGCGSEEDWPEEQEGKADIFGKTIEEHCLFDRQCSGLLVCRPDENGDRRCLYKSGFRGPCQNDDDCEDDFCQNIGDSGYAEGVGYCYSTEEHWAEVHEDLGDEPKPSAE